MHTVHLFERSGAEGGEEDGEEDEREMKGANDLKYVVFTAR